MAKEPAKKYESAESYFADFSGKTRERLDALQERVRKVVPDATERISYNIPAYFVGKKLFVYIAGFENHVSLYPGRALSDDFNRIAGKYASGKSTIKFPHDEALPNAVIDDALKLRLREIS